MIKVFNTVELYFDNLIDKKEAIHRLRYEKLNLQMCLRTQTVLDEYLHYEGSWTDLTANPILLQKNIARIIEAIFEKEKSVFRWSPWNFSICSALYPLLCEGVSDLHCMSDEYLKEELIFEYEETWYTNEQSVYLSYRGG